MNVKGLKPASYGTALLLITYFKVFSSMSSQYAAWDIIFYVFGVVLVVSGLYSCFQEEGER